MLREVGIHEDENSNFSKEDSKEDSHEDRSCDPANTTSSWSIELQKNESTLSSPTAGDATPEALKRERKMNPHKKISFAEMATTISSRWKKVSPERLAECQRRVDQDKRRFEAELRLFMEKKNAATCSGNTLHTNADCKTSVSKPC